MIFKEPFLAKIRVDAEVTLRRACKVAGAHKQALKQDFSMDYNFKVKATREHYALVLRAQINTDTQALWSEIDCYA